MEAAKPTLPCVLIGKVKGSLIPRVMRSSFKHNSLSIAFLCEYLVSRFTYTVEERETEKQREMERDWERERESGWAGFLYLFIGTWSVYLMLKAKNLGAIFILAQTQ